MTGRLSFAVTARDGRARSGVIGTRHGSIRTPVFMPVGTLATVKAVSTGDLVSLGAEIILGNAYHLMVRPGAERIARLGGLHRFMAWPRPVLTDSGGFQVMSLAALRRIDESGVTFRSHLDGAPLFLSPEESVRIQRLLGADIMMAFDECPPLPSPREAVERAVDRTTRWAERSLLAGEGADNALFGIVQGGAEPDLRERSARAITSMPFDGFALGGLSVGEDPAVTRSMVDLCAPMLPEGRPRYLMGVGRPEDLVEATWRGIDMFDCVLPTRNARNGSLFTSSGSLSIKRAEFAEDPRPVDETCGCPTCRDHSRAYLRHLYMAGEMLGSRLNTVHNLHHVLQLMRDMRAAIEAGRLDAFRGEFWTSRAMAPPGGE